jgi:hypothetical protein
MISLFFSSCVLSGIEPEALLLASEPANTSFPHPHEETYLATVVAPSFSIIAKISGVTSMPFTTALAGFASTGGAIVPAKYAVAFATASASVVASTKIQGADLPGFATP